ncbi:DciA family protein [Streptomyces sp. 8N114]|uniref:DciA family protein n=1 Tax=Streptomyces sp. 8N114 TaxID=3457419 RepID=UPI003FD29DF9
MTDTTTPAPAGAPPQPSADLARVALHQAREAARARGTSEARTPRTRRPRTALRRDGRDPQGLGAVLQGLLADRGWEAPAAGGTVLEQWPTIAAAISPTLPAHATAVAFDAKTGQLDLRPDSPAYATQLRLITARIIAAANQTAGTEAVRTVRVLPVGAAPAPRAPEPAPTPPAAPGDVAQAREPSEGYRQALKAHRAWRSDRHQDPAIARAIERQTQALLKQREAAFAHGHQAAEEDEQTRPAPASADVSRARALARARAGRAGMPLIPTATSTDQALPAPHSPTDPGAL